MINKEEILDRTNRGLDVFKYYLRIDFRPGKTSRIRYMMIKMPHATSTLTGIHAPSR